ncbi:putative E3 ubiquitin-protein ligase [Dirofilaria immitis]
MLRECSLVFFVRFSNSFSGIGLEYFGDLGMSNQKLIDETSSVTIFRSRKGARRNVASKRKSVSETSDSSNEAKDENVVIKYVDGRKKRKNLMVQSTVRRKIQKASESTSSSSNEEELIQNDPLLVTFASSGTAERAGPSDMGATAISEIDTDMKSDAQAQFERVQQILKEERDDKIYRGAALYGAKEKKDTVWGNASSGLNRFGPIRAPNFLRQSVRWDFAPDICKDYKETGFCTFGDSCKFLHDRTDYKHGWEIERDFSAGRMKEDDEDKYRISSGDEEEEQSELPFKCFICRQSFVNPVVTKCKHYFCEKCALEHFQKTPKCYICEQNTMGVFKVAKDLIGRLKENEDNQKHNDFESSSKNDGKEEKNKETRDSETDN